MTRLLIPLLFFVAVVVAVVCVIRRRRLNPVSVRSSNGPRQIVLIMAAAMLSIFGGGCGSSEPSSAAQAEAAWSNLRTHWLKIDTFVSETHNDYWKEKKSKLKDHAVALQTLLDAGVIEPDVAAVIEDVFNNTVHGADIRPSGSELALTCYNFEMCDVSEARDRSVARIAESMTLLDTLEAEGKLSPAVIRKARESFKTDLQIAIIMKPTLRFLPNRDRYDAVTPIANAYIQGERLDIDIDPAVAKAADFIMRLVAQDSPETALEEEPKEQEAGIETVWSNLRTLWLELDSFKSKNEQVNNEKVNHEGAPWIDEEFNDLWTMKDTRKSQSYEEFMAEEKSKRDAHSAALLALLDVGAIEPDVAEVLKNAFNGTISIKRPRRDDGLIVCYLPPFQTDLSDALLLSRRRIAESFTNLAWLEAEGKLSPAVVTKARENLEMDLQITALSYRVRRIRRQHAEADLIAAAYNRGEAVDIDPAVAKAADVIMRLVAPGTPERIEANRSLLGP